MTLKKCTLCGTPIVLYPTAKARAARWGGTASYYTNLFTTHSACTVAARDGAWSAEALRKLLKRDPGNTTNEYTAQGLKKLDI